MSLCMSMIASIAEQDGSSLAEGLLANDGGEVHTRTLPYQDSHLVDCVFYQAYGDLTDSRESCFSSPRHVNTVRFRSTERAGSTKITFTFTIRQELPCNHGFDVMGQGIRRSIWFM